MALADFGDQEKRNMSVLFTFWFLHHFVFLCEFLIVDCQRDQSGPRWRG